MSSSESETLSLRVLDKRGNLQSTLLNTLNLLFTYSKNTDFEAR